MPATEASDGMYVMLPVHEVSDGMIHGTENHVMVPLDRVVELKGAVLDQPGRVKDEG